MSSLSSLGNYLSNMSSGSPWTTNADSDYSITTTTDYIPWQQYQQMAIQQQPLTHTPTSFLNELRAEIDEWLKDALN